MTVDPSVVPGLLFLLAELVALAGVGYVIVRTALREKDDRVALAQGLVVGPAIWGVVVNLVMYVLPGLPGAVAGWIFVLALAAVLVWHSSKLVRPRLLTAAIFALVALALFWIALASRQTLGIPEAPIHIGLAASIREGAFPPEIPYAPGVRAPYHYGAYLLNGLLAPPSGPNLAFSEELLGAYAWMSLLLVVVTALLRRAPGFALLITAPMLLAAGSLPMIAIPAGIPSAGLLASLTDIFWPLAEQSASSPNYELPNVRNPAFTLSYALAFIVLARAARVGRGSWPKVITLAVLVACLGLTSSTLTPIVFILWAGLEAIWLIQSRRANSARRSDVVRSVSGLALAALLLLAGGFSAIVLDDSAPSGLIIGTSEFFGGWRLLGDFDQLPGGVGILRLGSLAIATAAMLLAWRDRLVQALVAATAALVLATLLLTYEPRPWDLLRLEDYARNLALFALLIALAVRLASLRLALRCVVIVAIAAVIVWPTTIVPVRGLGRVVANEIEIGNARRTHESLAKRFVIESIPSDRIADYIRKNSEVGARVFSPHPHQLTFNTGRPNASGFAGLIHLLPVEGPEYQDVLRYLEPAAIRRLGFEYIHAPDVWVDGLPDEAAAWLADPSFFELLIRDDAESLYRVLPMFLSLDKAPAAGSYEALRQAVPASKTIFLPEIFEATSNAHVGRSWVRTASALSHTRPLGFLDPTWVHLRTPWRAEPLGDEAPDLMITPVDFLPWVLPPAVRQPIWWNEETAVYSLDGAVEPIMPPPPWAEPLPFSVRVSEVHEADGRIAFTATFDDDGPDQWTSQDWVMIATQGPLWDLPKKVLPNGSTAIAMWFVSYLNPGRGTSFFRYEFDFQVPSLAVRRENGVLKPLERSEGVLDSDSYLLAVRLRHEYKPSQWRDTAIIPVLRITVSETGDVSYQIHEDVRGS